VISCGLIGVLSGYPYLHDHADHLDYAFEAISAGFMFFAVCFGLIYGSSVGAVIGLLIGGAIGYLAGRPRRLATEPVRWLDIDASERPGPVGRRNVIPGLLAAVISVALLGLAIAPVVSRRRELAEVRAELDIIGSEVARLGGRPDFSTSYGRRVDLGDTDVTDDGFIRLTHFKGFDRVHSIALRNTRITGTSITALKDLDRSLMTIDLLGTIVTDQSMKHLFRIYPRLSDIKFARTRVSDDGLLAIPDGLKLQRADFRGTAVTENGLLGLCQRIDLLGELGYGDPSDPKRIRGWRAGEEATPLP